MPFLPGYTSRWEYTIDATKVPSTQTNFPVYVDLSDMPASFWATVANGGGDIRVTRANGVTECAREVVSCDTATDTGELHFLANTVDGTTNTKYYIYANGTSADYAVTDTYGRNNVWGDYRFVSHDGGGTDSTGTYTPTNNGSISVGGVSGKIGAGSDFNGSTQYFRVSSLSLNTTGEISVSAWINNDVTPSGQQYPWEAGNTGLSDAFTVSGRRNGSNADIFTISSTGTVYGVTGQSGISTGNWHQFHQTIKTDGTMWMYIDGGQKSSISIPAITLRACNYLNIGADRANNRKWDGKLDELRVAELQFTANWITTEYNNQSNHATWATIGAEENPAGGSVNNALYSFGGM